MVAEPEISEFLFHGQGGSWVVKASGGPNGLEGSKTSFRMDLGGIRGERAQFQTLVISLVTSSGILLGL